MGVIFQVQVLVFPLLEMPLLLVCQSAKQFTKRNKITGCKCLFVFFYIKKSDLLVESSS